MCLFESHSTKTLQANSLSQGSANEPCDFLCPDITNFDNFALFLYILAIVLYLVKNLTMIIADD